MSSALARRLIGTLSLVVVGACREGSELSSGFFPVTAVPESTQACAPTQAPMTATEIFSDPNLGPLSQIAAFVGTVGADTLFWSGSDGSLHELTVPDAGGPPSDAVLVPAGTIEANYLAPAIALPAQVSGIAVFDSELLIVAEHASNTLVWVDRTAPQDLRRVAGVFDSDGGFGSGTGDDIRFHFTTPVPLLMDGAGFLWVGDTENHALRRVEFDGPTAALTIAGTGAAGASTGSLPATRFDTPSGLAASCLGELLLVESGAAGLGGNVLKSLRIGGMDPFGGFEGSSMVLAGDGTNQSVDGIGAAASLGTPMGIVATADGRVHWIDALAPPVLRRFDPATGQVDTPGLLGPSFEGESFSLAVGQSGALYVLGTNDDGTDGKLWQVVGP